VRLRHCSSSGSYPGDWVALFKMKTGQHEYKFNVDGGWRVAPADPLVMDPEVRHLGRGRCAAWRGRCCSTGSAEAQHTYHHVQ
jgi:predicted secreted protein